MNVATLWDHLFIVVVFIAYPLYSWRSFPSFAEAVREQGEPAKITGYRETIATWLGFSVVLVALWLLFDRAWSGLGLNWVSSLPAGLAAFLALVILWINLRRMRKLPDGGAGAAADQLGDAILLIPRTRRELVWFRAMAINAGLTEELVFRGFLLWYLKPYVGVVWAAVLAVLLFTLAHAYQGVGNLPALALASAFLVGLYLWSGSLLLPMLVHALADLMQGEALASVQKATPLEATESLQSAGATQKR